METEPIILKKLLRGRYEKLQKYFTDIEIQDLFFIDKKEILDACLPEHKILMSIFVERILRDIFRSFEQPFRDFSYDLNQHTPLFDQRLKISNKKEMLKILQKEINHPGLDLRCAVRGTIFLPDEFNLFHLIDFLKSKKIDQINYIDLAGNNFTNDDIYPLREIISLLPNLKAINLSGNQFFPSDQLLNFIQWMTDLPITFISMISSFDEEIGSKFSAETLKKLIWLSPACIEEGSFEYIVSLENIEIVTHTHQRYYKMYWCQGSMYTLF